MAKIVLDEVAGGYDLSKINDNFNKIELEFQNKVFYRDNPDGEPNTLEDDVDVNSKRIYNLPAPIAGSDAARLTDVQAAIAGLPTASTVPFTPAGTIAATTVQGAVQELDTETQSALALKAPLASPTFTGDPKAPTPSVGDSDTSIATTAFVSNEISSKYSSGFGSNAGFSFKNKIINGNFDIWQRGTSQTATGYGSADRLWSEHGGATTKTASQQLFSVGQTDVPHNPVFFLRHVVTAGAGASDFALFGQKLEDVRTFQNTQYVLSFWAKSDASRSLAIEVSQNFGSGGSSSVNTPITQVNLTTSWQRFTVPITFPSITGKTVGTGSFVQISFWMDAGSTFNARTGSLGHQSGTFDIAQLQLEEGAVATPFEARPLGVELALCQRYYEEVYSAWGTAAAAGMRQHAGYYRVEKRVSPTLTVYADSNVGAKVGATNAVRNVTAASNITLTTAISLPMTFVLDYPSPAGAANMQATVTADAEL